MQREVNNQVSEYEINTTVSLCIHLGMTVFEILEKNDQPKVVIALFLHPCVILFWSDLSFSNAH
jgi:hypothetical protein